MDVPNEIFYTIWNNLNGYSLYQCISVCRTWHDFIVYDKGMKKKIQTLPFNVLNLCRICQKPAAYNCPCHTTKYCSYYCQRADWDYHCKKCITSKHLEFKQIDPDIITMYDQSRPIEYQIGLDEKRESNLIKFVTNMITNFRPGIYRPISYKMYFRLVFGSTYVNLYPEKIDERWTRLFERGKYRGTYLNNNESYSFHRDNKTFVIEFWHYKLVCKRSDINEVLKFIDNELY